MRLSVIALALLALLLVAGAAAARGPPDVVDDVVWIVRCVGDSLNGAACHG